MEFKSLLIGFAFTIGIFAVKSGVGLYYLAEGDGAKKKILFSLAYVTVYFFIFLISGDIIKSLDIIHYMEILKNILKTGMFIHIIVAALLGAWGIFLLRQAGWDKKKSLGWLALIIPCPVCLTVIFFTIAFLFAFFPDSGRISIFGAYAGFMLLSFLSATVLYLFNTVIDSTPESLLGGSMLFISAYFILSVIIMPQFADIDKIYRMAAYDNPGIDSNVSTFWILCIFSLIIAVGFFISKKKIKITRRL